MNITDIINSGDVELYVYGVLSESETEQMADMSNKHKTLKDEILLVENSILQLSSSFAPNISSEVYEKIKQKIGLKPTSVIEMKPKSSISQYIGWAAALALLVGIVYQYNKQTTIENEIVTIEKEKIKLNEAVATSENKNKQTKQLLDVIRDAKNTVVTLGGQAVAPKSFAKVYWNKETQVVYVDAAGLPEPPEGMVYQVWSLKLSPTLTPTSIGLLENFTADNNRIFAVSNTADAEAFGITLEPAGGSETPTMEQLYTLGKV
ncbi:MAG: anti-sigma factor [Bacteroidota bacterium]